MNAIDRAKALRRPKEEAMHIQVDPLPKLGGKLAAIDPKAVEEYQRDMSLWMERLIDQIRRVVAEN